MHKKLNLLGLKTIHYYIFVSVIIGMIILLISFPEGFLSANTIVFVFIYSIAIGIPSMMSMKLIENKLEMRIPWLIKPFRRLIISVLLKVVIVFIILMLINYLFFFLIKGQSTREFFSNTLKGFIYASAIIIAGIVIENSVYFFRSWRQSAINEEILKREKLAIEYEALKNQVNPHFLFNSLSSLTTLVYKDKEKAVTFILEFAGVYRYVLECRDKEIVDLATERKFLESMTYLYQIRHENSLQIKIDLPASEDKYVIPMVLQMLLENAIKHNTLSTDSPLLIEIWADEEYVTVKNNLKPKILTPRSSKVGLVNIQKRYDYLSDKKVVIDKTDKHFIIKIPLLTKENETSANHRR